MQNYVSNYFYRALESHGISATRSGDWITVENGYPAFRAFYEPPKTERTSGSLSVQIMLDKDSLVEECFAAFGSSDEEAITGALEQFAITMFHPIIAACCGYPVDDHVTQETWKIGLLSKVEIWASNIATRMTSDVKLDTPLDWLDEISRALKRTNVSKGYSWTTLYCSRLDDNPLIASASLNNDDWPAGLEATKNLNWPRLSGFYGARMFIIVVR